MLKFFKQSFTFLAMAVEVETGRTELKLFYLFGIFLLFCICWQNFTEEQERNRNLAGILGHLLFNSSNNNLSVILENEQKNLSKLAQ